MCKICLYTFVRGTFKMKQGIKVAVMGYGTVGGGVCDILTEKSEALGQKIGEPAVALKYVLDIRDLSKTSAAPYWVKSVDDIVSDPEVGVVVETMGGVEPAFTFCMKCLNAGKSVVTSNKQLVAEKGEALFEAARAHNVAFRFGAAVCGGIPVLRTLVYGLAANRIDRFAGILNGTTNYILTKMFEEGARFEDALAEAQAMGYAEANPAADIEGADTCRKTAILCSLAFGSHVYPEAVRTEGIAGVQAEDAACAAACGCRIRLIGWGERENGAVKAGVAPMLVKNEELLSHVEGVYNAITVTGDKIGSVLLYGQGAGKDATASAVAADVLDCGRKPGFDAAYSWGKNGGFTVSDGADDPVKEIYVRGSAENAGEALRAICESCGAVTRLTRENQPAGELAFLAANCTENGLRSSLRAVPGFTLQTLFRVL